MLYDEVGFSDVLTHFAASLFTHNAGIAAIAHRVVVFADGAVREVRENAERKSPRDISW